MENSKKDIQLIEKADDKTVMTSLENDITIRFSNIIKDNKKRQCNVYVGNYQDIEDLTRLLPDIVISHEEIENFQSEYNLHPFSEHLGVFLDKYYTLLIDNEKILIENLVSYGTLNKEQDFQLYKKEENDRTGTVLKTVASYYSSNLNFSFENVIIDNEDGIGELETLIFFSEDSEKRKVPEILLVEEDLKMFLAEGVEPTEEDIKHFIDKHYQISVDYEYLSFDKFKYITTPKIEHLKAIENLNDTIDSIGSEIRKREEIIKER